MQEGKEGVGASSNARSVQGIFLSEYRAHNRPASVNVQVVVFDDDGSHRRRSYDATNGPADAAMA